MQDFLLHLKSQRIAIIGFGVTGLASAKFLCNHGIQFLWVDSRLSPAALKDAQALQAEYSELIELIWGDNWHVKLSKMQQIIASPGVSVESFAKYCPKAEITSDIGVFAQCTNQPIIAITGSNGKSTVTMLVSHLLNNAGIKAVVGGNIGIPVLDLLNESFDVAVLELSSFQLEITPTIDYRSAVFLNISEDHMDRYSNLDAYVAAKQKIFHGAQLAVCNAADENTRPVSLPMGASLKEFFFDVCSQSKAIDEGSVAIADIAYCDGDSLFVGKQRVCEVSGLTIAGQHNIANALAALQLLAPWGLSSQILRDGLVSFSGLLHRCQVVSSNDGVRWINDSKATNVGATIAALQGLKNSTRKRLILLLGGDGKSADFSVITEAAYQFADRVICFGQDAEQIVSELKNEYIYRLLTFSEALSLASQIAEEGDTVLLSPACASFDEFKSFEARGDAFCQFVKCRELS